MWAAIFRLASFGNCWLCPRRVMSSVDGSILIECSWHVREILFLMLLRSSEYLGHWRMKCLISSFAPQLIHFFSSSSFLLMGSCPFKLLLPILSWWNITWRCLFFGKESYVCWETFCWISFKWWPVLELSHVICQFCIVFFWMAFLMAFRVMLLLRGLVLSLAPSLAATSAISFPLISACSPIQLIEMEVLALEISLDSCRIPVTSSVQLSLGQLEVTVWLRLTIQGFYWVGSALELSTQSENALKTELISTQCRFIQGIFHWSI